MNKKITAFTLTEVITVIVIVGIIAAFMLPSYSKASMKIDERNMIANLRSIRTAVITYTGAGGTIGTWNSLSSVNTNLGLSILDTKAPYDCNGTTCGATHPGTAGWGIRFAIPDGRLYCNNGPCPTCGLDCG